MATAPSTMQGQVKLISSLSGLVDEVAIRRDSRKKNIYVHLKQPFELLYDRLLHMCGGDFYSEEAGGLLHDGCICSHPAHRRPLLAFLLDQS